MDDSECMICFENMDDNIAVLKCGHRLHFDCVCSWIETKKNNYNFCPICDQPNEIINVISKNPYPKIPQIIGNNSSQNITRRPQIIGNNSSQNITRRPQIIGNNSRPSTNNRKSCTIL